MTGKQKTPSKPGTDTNSITDADWKTERLSTLPQAHTDYMAKPFSYQNYQSPRYDTSGKQAGVLQVILCKKKIAAFKTLWEMSSFKALSTIEVFLSYNKKNIEKHWVHT